MAKFTWLFNCLKEEITDMTARATTKQAIQWGHCARLRVGIWLD